MNSHPPANRLDSCLVPLTEKGAANDVHIESRLYNDVQSNWSDLSLCCFAVC
jgi:hypothetical protein